MTLRYRSMKELIQSGLDQGTIDALVDQGLWSEDRQDAGRMAQAAGASLEDRISGGENIVTDLIQRYVLIKTHPKFRCIGPGQWVPEAGQVGPCDFVGWAQPVKRQWVVLFDAKTTSTSETTWYWPTSKLHQIDFMIGVEMLRRPNCFAGAIIEWRKQDMVTWAHLDRFEYVFRTDYSVSSAKISLGQCVPLHSPSGWIDYLKEWEHAQEED